MCAHSDACKPDSSFRLLFLVVVHKHCTAWLNSLPIPAPVGSAQRLFWQFPPAIRLLFLPLLYAKKSNKRATAGSQPQSQKKTHSHTSDIRWLHTKPCPSNCGGHARCTWPPPTWPLENDHVTCHLASRLSDTGAGWLQVRLPSTCTGRGVPEAGHQQQSAYYGQHSTVCYSQDTSQHTTVRIPQHTTVRIIVSILQSAFHSILLLTTVRIPQSAYYSQDTTVSILWSGYHSQPPKSG